MGFKRAEWHSGLTYQQTCDNCNTVFQYTDYSLDYRPWYADGYVDCPKCKNHMRHNENYAINGPNSTPVVPVPNAQVQPMPIQDNPVQSHVNTSDPVAPAKEQSFVSSFCTQCGKKFNEADRFCAGCGAKRD